MKVLQELAVRHAGKLQWPRSIGNKAEVDFRN